MVRIKTQKEEFTVDYPEAVDFTEKQEAIFWTSNEIRVEKDKQDILVNMTEAERYFVVHTLRLFTKYEQIIGDEFWINFVFKKYPRAADIQPMAALFAAVELAVHTRFYSRLNEELGLATDEFYQEYKLNPVLNDRIEYLKSVLSDDDELKSLGCFTFGEGAILYSNFAFLKHFQSMGKNKLLNVVSGINFSSRDEALHSEAAGWLFQQVKHEKLLAGEIDKDYCDKLEEDIFHAADIVYEHECAIIDEGFSKGKIEGITDIQLKNFVKSRINICMRNMGYKDKYDIDYNPIAEWFYKGINGYRANDFFNAVGNQYERNWSAEGFTY